MNLFEFVEVLLNDDDDDGDDDDDYEVFEVD
jgi:hypothetical protein